MQMKKKPINLKQILICDLVVLLLLGVFLYFVEIRATEERMKINLTDRLETLRRAFEKADDDTYDTAYRYELRMNSSAQALAFLYDHEENFTVTSDLLQTFDVVDIYVGDESEIEKDEEYFGYYSAEASDGTVITIAVSKFDLKIILDSIYTENKIISKMGNLTDLFLITDEEGTIRYFQEEGFKGQDISALGITMDSLIENDAKWLKINDTWYYVSSKTNDYLGIKISCGIAADKMMINTNIAICALFVVITIVFTTVITFVYFSKQQNKKNADNELYSVATVRRRIAAFTMVGMLIIGIAAFFIQSLFCLSLSSLSMFSDIQEIRSALNEAESDVELMTDFFNYYSLSHAKSISYIMSKHPECRNEEDLKTLSYIYDLKYIMLFDTEGNEYLSDSPIVGFVISDDPEDQSYDFNLLKYGIEYVIQEPQNEELTGEYRQFIGVQTYDTEGKRDGFLLTAISPYDLELLTDELSLKNILFNTVAATGNDAFAVDTNTGIFTYNTQEELIGYKAVDYGIKERKLKHNYFGSLTMDGNRYYVTSHQFDDQLVYVGDRITDIFKGRELVVLIAILLSFLNLMVLTVIINNRDVVDARDNTDDLYVDVETPTGDKKPTLNIIARVIKQRINWEDKIPEDKTAFVVNVIVQIMAIILLIVISYYNVLDDDTSLLGFIINGKWQKGLNIFALTAVVIYVIVYMFVMNLLNVFFSELIKLVSPKSETFFRLTKSFIRYFGIIALFYYSLMTFGFDSTSLLASAGVLTLVVGLGARDLVTDILAGIFIIFENEFQVGDIIEIGGFKGRVVEIGIRSTKIMNTVQDVKSINNRDMNKIVNKTKRNSYCDIVIKIPFGQDINAIEKMLDEELPKVKDKCPYILSGPTNGGIDEISDNGMKLSIRTECLEAYKFEVRTVVNKELMELFEKYGFRLGSQKKEA